MKTTITVILLIALSPLSAFATGGDETIGRPYYAVCVKAESLGNGVFRNEFTLLGSDKKVKVDSEQPMIVAKEYCLTRTMDGWMVVGLLMLVDPATQSVVV